MIGYVSDDEVQIVQNLLNNRFGKSLNYLTTNEVLNKEISKDYKKYCRLFDNGRNTKLVQSNIEYNYDYLIQSALLLYIYIKLNALDMHPLVSNAPYM